jgi:outer membrane protein insertion porin family
MRPGLPHSLTDATMTPPCPRRLLALALASALAGPAWAQTTDPFALPQQGRDAEVPPPPPVEPFVVGDIRVDGLQRISAGTVFTYLPIQRGDRVDATAAANAIRALYRTGFFEDVRLDRQGDILVVTVVERPAINKLTITGNKDIKTEDLTKGLTEIGLAEGRTFDRLALDRVTQELTRQYNDRGKYNVAITPTVTRLDRNRVDVAIAIKEGAAARIRHINLIGNETFEDREITKGWESSESNWLSWYRRDDQYSREKLSGDLEKLNSFYLDRGYIDFSVDTPQVAISPDKQDIYITAGVTEGEQYRLSKVEVSGETILPKEQVEAMVFAREGQIFSRRVLELSSDNITAALGNVGYAFAQVNPIPDVDREARTVGINLQVQPGPRVNVRRIQFKGNTRTADEVLRREMRQFEGAWYSQAAIDRSKIRLQRLGFFESVDVETPQVPGSPDQVDLVFNVKETTSGNLTFGIGYSQLSGLTTSIQVSQANFLGSGNQLSMQVQRNDFVQRYDFSFLNPYFTDEGMSLGYNLRWREFDNANFNVAQFSSTSGSGQLVLGLPITETDTVTSLFGIDSNEIFVFPGATPKPIVDYINALGSRTFHAWRTELGWARDTRNDFFAPTRGMYQRISTEATLPGSTVEYYKINYEFSKYWPLTPSLVLNTRAELGYGDSYGDPVTRDICFIPPPDPTAEDPDPQPPPPSDPCIPGTSPDYIETVTADGLPFFENFYAGGVRSIRGFRDNTVGPRAEPLPGAQFGQPLGGAVKTVGSLELFFPRLLATPAIRISTFLDFGNVFTNVDDFDVGTFRVSTGVAILWRAPIGPISISYAFPLREFDGDQTERLQFTFGGGF